MPIHAIDAGTAFWICVVPREWHAEDEAVWLLIVGPVLDKDCAEALMREIAKESSNVGTNWNEIVMNRGVAYVPAVSRDKLLSAFLSASAILNSSKCEVTVCHKFVLLVCLFFLVTGISLKPPPHWDSVKVCCRAGPE